MYTKPTVERYGSFRDLTKIGMGADGDGGIGHGFLDGQWGADKDRS
ncbi:MAG: lasso RiPP family leader peptide-containing protein [Pirellulaceae bacterium]|nr:lasso RiPP family leader peptide-containing protein [Pirellulaceae bacterium]